MIRSAPSASRPFDFDEVTRLVETVAAEEIMPRYQRLATGDIREKSPGDLVTVADEAVENRLAPLLMQLEPGSVVVGEEAVAADPTLLGRISQQAPLWVIDPIDGTTNFAEGRPFFGLMVALVRQDRVVAGWIHDPVNRATIAAEEGSGAWEAGRRVRVAAPPADPHHLTGALLAGHFGNRQLGQSVQARRDRVAAVKSKRSAAHEYLRLARGEMHFALFTKLMPWDHAAGVLIHQEAGGYSGYLNGGHYRPSRTRESGILLAPDEPSWKALHRILLE